MSPLAAGNNLMCQIMQDYGKLSQVYANSNIFTFDNNLVWFGTVWHSVA